MNFFDAELKQADGGLLMDTGVFQLHVPPGKAEPFRSHSGKRVVFGIRPEDIHDVQFTPPGITPGQIEANVEVVEQMGNEVNVYLEEGGKSFIARIDPRTRAHVGGRMGLVLDMDNMHVFDVDNELSLAYEHKQATTAKV
jgi:multiple sugar transport system ATP-binding protein